MLDDAKAFATQFSGQGSMWQNPFANPDPRAAIEKASGLVHRIPDLHDHQAGHLLPRHAGRRGPLGGVRGDRHRRPSTPARSRRPAAWSGWDPTPSVDGHFDRISTQIDEAFGTEEEFRSMCEVAAATAAW